MWEIILHYLGLTLPIICLLYTSVPDRGQFVGEVFDEAESEQNEMIKKIVLFFGVMIWTAPFLIMLLIAFSSKNTNSFVELLSENPLTFHNFITAWQEAEFPRYFVNTVIITRCV